MRTSLHTFEAVLALLPAAGNINTSSMKALLFPTLYLHLIKQQNMFSKELLLCNNINSFFLYMKYVKYTHVIESLCLFWLVGGTRVLHTRALLLDVHVCRRMGHSWPKYPAFLLPSVEVKSHNRCLIHVLGWWVHVPNFFFFLGSFIGQLMDQRLCMTLSAWWMPTSSTTVRRSPGVNWAFICSLSSITCTGA